MIELLPLLEGWEDDSSLIWSGTITQEVKRVIKREVRIGWLQNALMITDDLYGAVETEYNNVKSGYLYPATAKLYGYDNLFPSVGHAGLRQYNNTGPGTAGLYVLAWDFWMYPIKGHVAVDAKLGELSSYSSATLAVVAGAFKIANMDVLKESLKKLYKELGLEK